jgi:small subunit ribosomal protein S20
MPILKCAQKALRNSKRKAIVNKAVKSKMKNSLKKIVKEATTENLKVAFSNIDKACKKNIFHKNKAARLKSQMSKLVNNKESIKK